MTKPSFVFLGSPVFAITILEGLVTSGWSPSLVVTEPPKPVGRHHTLTPTAVHAWAEARGLQVATPQSKEELVQVVTAAAPELLVVAAYGRILPKSLLTLGRYGAINVHASLLPQYRGASPIQAALLAGETATGISIMQMEPSLDTGPVLRTVTVPITPTDTTLSLTTRLANVAAATLPPTLDDYVTGTLRGVAQNDTEATYAPKLTSDDGRITLSTADPLTLDQMVRALHPWPGVYSEEFGERLKITEGHLANDTYVITQLQWAGKRPIDGATFARAYPSILTSLPKTTKLEASFAKPQDSVTSGH